MLMRLSTLHLGLLILIAGSCKMSGCKPSGDHADASEGTGSESAQVSPTSPSDSSVASADSTLTEAQRGRLGPALRRLLAGDTAETRTEGPLELSPAGKRDGKETYSVLIHGAEAKTLRRADVPYVSEVGGTVTARLTVGQIRRVASIEDVRRIRAAREVTTD